jgi:hypothetical protein
VHVAQWPRSLTRSRTQRCKCIGVLTQSSELFRVQIPSFRDISSMASSSTRRALCSRPCDLTLNFSPDETNASDRNLSPHEKRMQKTYNELFKLQNLLEKTVHSVAASNVLKSVPNNSTSSPADKRATETTGGGRPYYPGSPKKGESVHLFGLISQRDKRCQSKPATPCRMHLLFPIPSG